MALPETDYGDSRFRSSSLAVHGRARARLRLQVCMLQYCLGRGHSRTGTISMNQDWDIRPCNSECSGCGKSFADQEPYFSELVFAEEGYHRTDHCASCRDKAGERSGGAHSAWTGSYRPPPPPAEEVLERHTAESLLRELVDAADDSKGNLIYVLAVMLERKKILVEKDIQKRPDNVTTIVFEHRKTGESFLITDPHLRLDELEHVQSEVAEMLGVRPREGETSSGSSAEENGNEAEEELADEDVD